MNDASTLEKKAQGQQLSNAEVIVLTTKVMDAIVEGYDSENQLAKQLGVSRPTIKRYLPMAHELIAKYKFDRNAVRNLQLKRTYTLIEQLMIDLKSCETIKEKSMIYSAIFKFSSHLALITGLNIETQVNIDHKQLVIIRPAKEETPVTDVIEAESIDDLPVVSVQ